eukprot:6962411-Pyramimonas_sp.AAC.1
MSVSAVLVRPCFRQSVVDVRLLMWKEPWTLSQGCGVFHNVASSSTEMWKFPHNIQAGLSAL